MQTAIIGAGFSGLATAWNLSQKSDQNIVVIDTNPIGESTSGIAAGLLHPYAGAYSKRNRRADEAIAATLNLIAVSEKALGEKVCIQQGLIRPVTTKDQEIHFSQCASKYSDVVWMPSEECRKKVEGMADIPGIYISSAWIVNCQKYLQGLWGGCKSRGVRFEQRKIESLDELDCFDRIIVAGGALSKNIPELTHIPITPIKGQLLEIQWPDNHPFPSCPLSSQSYLLVDQKSKRGIIGATFEHHFDNLKPNTQFTADQLLPKTQAYFPAIHESMIIGCKAGVRASGPNHLPYIANLGNERWLLTGMGSKGLLYHALYAKELVGQLE